MSERTVETSMSEELPVDLAFDDGLVPVVAQSVADDAILMLAYANAEAIRRSRETGEAHYYSRSREELWHKGATSGNRQHVEDILVDCDADAVLYRVSETGGACHTGHRSCFYRRLSGEHVGEQVFEPDAVYE